MQVGSNLIMTLYGAKTLISCYNLTLKGTDGQNIGELIMGNSPCASVTGAYHETRIHLLFEGLIMEAQLHKGEWAHWNT